MKKIEMIKNLIKKMKESITDKEFLEGLLEIGAIDNSYDNSYIDEEDNDTYYYIDDITYYLYRRLDSLVKLHSWSTELDEVYNKKYNHWKWIYETVDVLYDFNSNVFVFIHENELREIKELVAKRAPKWFKAGWKGLVSKTLSDEEFISYYCNLRDNNCFKKVNFALESEELKGNYFKLKNVESLIKDFLQTNPQMALIVKNVAA